MNTVANMLHRIAYRLAPTSYRITESQHHGQHRITLDAGGNRYVMNYHDSQHPGVCDCE